MNQVLSAYKEQVICNIANPFPHLDLGAILQVKDMMGEGNIR
jgi:hypothetical protein